jgi:hypothetical protein
MQNWNSTMYLNENYNIKHTLKVNKIDILLHFISYLEFNYPVECNINNTIYFIFTRK